MEKRNIVVFILSFLILATTGIIFVFMKGAQTAPFVVPQPQPQPPPTPTAQTPADWKTYRNETMKFEIKYPSDWKVDEIVSQMNGKKESIIIYKGEKIVTIPGSPISPYGKTLSVGIVERGKTCGDCNIYSPKELQETQINGYRAIGTIYNEPMRSGFWVYSPFQEHVVHLDYVNPPKIGEKDEQTDRLFKMILPTFRFLE